MTTLHTNQDICGSHMPLDTTSHWNWRNPLNLFVYSAIAFIILAFVLSIF